MVTSSFPSRQRGPCRASGRGSFLGGAFLTQSSELRWKELRNSKAKNSYKQPAPKVRPFCAQIHAVFVPVARLQSPFLIKREHSGDDTQVSLTEVYTECVRFATCRFYFKREMGRSEGGCIKEKEKREEKGMEE